MRQLGVANPARLGNWVTDVRYVPHQMKPTQAPVLTKKKVLLLPALLAAALAGVQTARADPFENGSFEAGDFVANTRPADLTDDLQYGSTAITGWTVFGASDVAWIENGNDYTDNLSADDGSYFLDLTGYKDGAPYGGVEQTFDTIAGDVYDVSFALGYDLYYDDTYEGSANTPGITVQAVGDPQYFYTGTLTGDQWQIENFVFTADSSSTTLSFQGISEGGGSGNVAYIGLDNVQVQDESIPSTPDVGSSAGLLLAALLGTCCFKRSARRQPG